MSYKIAIVSSDGVNVDGSFGSAERFYIYEVNDREYALSEVRKFDGAEKSKAKVEGSGCGKSCEEVRYENVTENCSGKRSENCAEKRSEGCAGGCASNENSPKLEAVLDCRSVVAGKIGFNIRKQLERKAITAFDVEVSVKEALEKISEYFYKTDRRISLRNRSKESQST